MALGAAAVVASVGIVGAFGPMIGAQPAADAVLVEVVSVDESGIRQDLPADPRVALSDSGGVVAYDTFAAAPGAGSAAGGAPDRRVWVRDRVAGTGRGVAEPGSAAPGISGNGCIVAYSVSVAGGGIALTTVDRCATPANVPLPLGAVVDTVPATDATPPVAAPPALSFDGSTIVWSTGREVRRYQRSGPTAAFVRTHAFDVTAEADADAVTGADVDMSADGTVVVFVAGPGAGPYQPTPANVYSWTLSSPQSEPELLSPSADGTPAPADSTSPTVSADGSYVVFESASRDLAAVGGATVELPVVVGVDRATRTAQVLLSGAGSPAISGDGNSIAYTRGGAIGVLTSDGTNVVDVAPAALTAAQPIGPLAISQFGRWIVFASAADLASAASPAAAASTGPAVWAADRRSSEQSVADTTTTSTTTTTSVSPSAPTTTVGPPGSTSPPPSVPPVTAPGSVTSPTMPATTLLPSVVTPRFPTTSLPGVVLPQQPRPAPPTAPTSSTSGGFGSGVTFGVAGIATPVTFEPTVAGVGRRVLPVTLTSTQATPLRVLGAVVESPGAFSVTSDGCAGVQLSVGATCSAQVEFAPVAVGPATTIVSFRLADGSAVVAIVGGEGVPNPTLDVVPAVAGAGQTVTVFGAGFPAGSTVEFVQPGVAVPEPIVIDPDGTFAQVVVVLPQTPTGPVRLSVNAQPDVFDDVGVELLVSSRGATSDGAALRGSAGSVLGN